MQAVHGFFSRGFAKKRIADSTMSMFFLFMDRRHDRTLKRRSVVAEHEIVRRCRDD